MSQALQLTLNAKRPNYNTTIGQPVPVRTNHYKVDSLPTANITQWSVDFKSDGNAPKTKAAMMRRNESFWALDEVQSAFKGVKVIYNGGGIAWSIKKLPFDSLQKVIQEKNNVRIHMMYATTINLETLARYLKGAHSWDDHVIAAITFLDAALRDGPSRIFPTVLKNSFFNQHVKSNVFDLGGGAQLWRGVFQSARLGPGYMTVNVDVAHTAFYRPDVSVPDLLTENLHLQSEKEISQLKNDKRRMREASKLLKGLGVYTTHTKRRDGASRPEKIFQINWTENANTRKFEKDGKMVTITNYFKSQYNIVLRYPTFPLLDMKGGKSVVPMELCMVAAGQKFPNALLTGQQTAEIVKQAAQPPLNRLQTTSENVKSLSWGTDTILKDLGFKINTAGIIAKSRLFQPPSIAYGPKSRPTTVQARDGKWNASGKQLINCARLQSWGICKFTGPRDDTSQFEREIVLAGSRAGVDMVAKTPFIQSANPHGDIQRTVEEFYRSTGNKFQKAPQILFFVVPGRGTSEIYGEIKRVCDTKLGIPSQCISGANLRKANAQYCDNVFLKVNPKLGGLNTRLSTNPFSAPTLLLGADVSHPPAGLLNAGAASIASLVSNNDLNATSFIGQARSQTARTEVIEQMENLTKNAIKAYISNATENPKGIAPKAIIYYRDGVGEGQFEQIKAVELAAIKAACASQRIDPKITVVICQKRHHTRFFPTKQQDGDRLGNVKAGTCVDSDITHPHEFDFFLVAHTSFKGTARPTHYHVIHDENKFRAESLQKLTFDLCHTFARSTTSVSLVPVAYYAHLVGNRVKAYCSGGSDTASVASSAMDVNPEAALPALHANLRTRMWYI